jgi:hypothetical protein
MCAFAMLKPVGPDAVRLDFRVRKRVSYALEIERKCLRELISPKSYTARECTGSDFG